MEMRSRKNRFSRVRTPRPSDWLDDIWWNATEDRYRAFNFGIGKNMGALGALSVDAAQANSTLPDEAVSMTDNQCVSL